MFGTFSKHRGQANPSKGHQEGGSALSLSVDFLFGWFYYPSINPHLIPCSYTYYYLIVVLIGCFCLICLVSCFFSSPSSCVIHPYEYSMYLSPSSLKWFEMGGSLEGSCKKDFCEGKRERRERVGGWEMKGISSPRMDVHWRLGRFINTFVVVFFTYVL